MLLRRAPNSSSLGPRIATPSCGSSSSLTQRSWQTAYPPPLPLPHFQFGFGPVIRLQLRLEPFFCAAPCSSKRIHPRPAHHVISQKAGASVSRNPSVPRERPGGRTAPLNPYKGRCPTDLTMGAQPSWPRTARPHLIFHTSCSKFGQIVAVPIA